MIKNILLVAAVTALAACSSLSSLVKEPEVSYRSISVGEVSMQRIELNPTFNIANTNAFALPINSITYELSLNQQKMLAGETDDIGTLPANANKDVSLSLALTKETLTSLQQLLFKEKKLDYQVKGSVNALGLAIPFEKSATLYVPTVSIADLKIANATFSQLDIILSLEVDNQNDFSLPLDNLNYAVSTKGNALFKGELNSQKVTEGKSTIQLPLSIKPSDMFANVFALLMSPEVPLHFEITSPLFTKSFDQSVNLKSFFN
jgi:LEA14-like dessication related protein